MSFDLGFRTQIIVAKVKQMRTTKLQLIKYTMRVNNVPHALL